MYEEMFDERERHAMDEKLLNKGQATHDPRRTAGDERLALSLRARHSSVYRQVLAFNIPLHNFRNELVQKVLKFKDVINTPYMMKIIIDILPSLDEVIEASTFSDAQNVQVSYETVYKTFTRQFFSTRMSQIIESEPTDLPQGYDLM